MHFLLSQPHKNITSSQRQQKKGRNYFIISGVMEMLIMQVLFCCFVGFLFKFIDQGQEENAQINADKSGKGY